MTRLLLTFMLCVAAAGQAVAADDTVPPAPQSPPAQTPMPPAVADARAACEADVQKLCPGVQPGGGRILACLKQHKEDVSDGCKQALAKAIKGSN